MRLCGRVPVLRPLVAEPLAEPAMPDNCKPRRLLIAMGSACFGLSSVSGCYWLNPDKCPDLPCGAISAPPGAALGEWASAQAQRAEADDFVIYEADWVAGGTQLSPAAQGRLMRVADRVACGESCLLISPTENDGLNADRRFALENHLATAGWPGMADSIQIGTPAALDLLGREAPTVTRDLLSPRNLPNSPFTQSEGAFGGGAIANPFGFQN